MNRLEERVPSNFKLSVANLLDHNWNWERYKFDKRGSLTTFQVEQVENMLACRKQELGGMLYHCPNCGDYEWRYFSCMSRVCSYCGKRHSKEWGQAIMEKYLDVDHRHVIFTLPDELWGYVRDNHQLINGMLKAVKATIQELFDMRFPSSPVKPGIICVVHYTGRYMNYNPHIHALITEGGLDIRGDWRKHSYWPYEQMRKIWQDEVIKEFRRILPKDIATRSFLESVMENRDGFVVKNYRDLLNINDLGGYLSRYVRHPPIGESRILDYDGQSVKIKYEWDNKLHKIWIPIERFIDGIVSNIPPKGFQVVRYYGLYANTLYKASRLAIAKLKSNVRRYPKRAFTQQKLYEEPRCDKCGTPMKLVMTIFQKGTEWVVKYG